ncbi:hypothetical protein [Parasitella parasitica]|uniref:Uncharacterized protein n=1 Tax=Parasitella parasitica TaxID=35722 RepID=A0A0B7N041_9FUNG|nr:hypothetical protein [Parasitella parasitica]
MKPDTIDDYIQKPDTIDSPITAYDKPNTYDDNDNQIPQKYTATHLPQEVIDDLIVRAVFVDGKRPAIRTDDVDEDEDEDEDKDEAVLSSRLTDSLISHVPSSTTVLSTSSSNPVVAVSPSASSVSSNSSNASSATSRLALLQILKQKPMEDMLNYDLRKRSLARPQEHDIYFKGTKILAFKKVQPHSYSWGFQNILYRTALSTGERIKVAEARRRAFKKEITIEWGDFPVILSEKSSDQEAAEDEESEFDSESVVITATTLDTTKSNQLHNRTNSHLLFTYDTEFEGYRIRWKRTSLLSHDMVCQLRPDKHLEEGDAANKKWRVIAEFDSHRMGYFIHLGELIIDKNALKLVKRQDHLEAHILVTCCTLIDLMREVVEKAVGLNKGGVVGSD